MHTDAHTHTEAQTDKIMGSYVPGTHRYCMLVYVCIYMYLCTALYAVVVIYRSIIIMRVMYAPMHIICLYA